MPEPATIYQVASKARVSISTVSNVLNRPELVSAATRAKVLDAVDALDYTPSAKAVVQARKGMGRIAVMAPFTSYASFLQRLVGVVAAATAERTEVSVFDHESAATATHPVLATMPIRGQVDGLIVMGMPLEHDVETRLLERGLPTVLVDADSQQFPVVRTDDFAGGRLAAAHLLELGHRRFGYLVERQVSGYESQAIRRLAGFRAELGSHDIDDLVIIESDPDVGHAQTAAQALLSLPDRPTAIMAHYDAMAVGVLRAASDAGLAVPDHLSVIGFDDGPLAVGANLSTVRQPLTESGRVAFGILRAIIAKDSSARSATTLDLEFVRRSTTAPPHQP